MFAFTETELLKVKLDNIDLSLVQNINKEFSIFCNSNGNLEIFSQPKIQRISQISKNLFSWEIHGLEFMSNLETLEILLKSNLAFQAQDLFHDPFSWTLVYSQRHQGIQTSDCKSHHGKIDAVKYTIQKILTNTQICHYDYVKVWVGSWNVNSQMDLPVSLESWILNDDYDFCVFGFQELDTSTEAYIVQDYKREAEWSLLIEKKLKDYTKIISKQLVGMLVLVYVKSSLENYVSNVQTDCIGTGLLGMIGNKGAVAVRFMFKDSHFCFVNSHLAADVASMDKRNQDFREISSKLGFYIDNLKDFEEFCLHFPWISINYKELNSDLMDKTRLSIFDVE